MARFVTKPTDDEGPATDLATGKRSGWGRY